MPIVLYSSLRFTRTALICAGLAALLSATICTQVFARDTRTVDVQRALTWLGFYDGLPHGKLNSYTRSAIRKYQRYIGSNATGQLTDSQRQDVITTGANRRSSAGFNVMTDSATGIQIGLPLAWLGQPTSTPWGRNWAAPDNEVDVDTLAFRDGRTLRALYDKLRQISGRKVRYKRFTGSEFILEGEDRDGRQFYVRAMASGSQVRGFSTTYERHAKSKVFPAIIAMSGSFEPFASQAVLASEEDRVPYYPTDAPRRNQTSTRHAENCWNGLGSDCPSLLRSR